MEAEKFHFTDATFKTSVTVDSPRDAGEVLKLPDAVNYVALRETCLSEAPFVSRSNRQFWKKWLDSSQYITILAASLKLVSDCINDVGSVNIYKLYDLSGNPLMEQMAVCIAELLLLDKNKFSRSQDIVFRRMPELLCYMTIGSLHSSASKQARIYNSVRFREVLLDWLSELIGGIRITNVQQDREWLFADANDISILVTDTPPVFLSHKPIMQRNSTMAASMGGAKLREQLLTRLPTIKDLSVSPMHIKHTKKGAAVSAFSIENSPLVKMYMNLGRSPEDAGFVCVSKMKVLLTHMPERPLTSMQPDTVLIPGNYRERKIVQDQVAYTLKSTVARRRQILKQYADNKSSMKQDLSRTTEAYKIQLAVLEKKPVSQRQLLTVATSNLDASSRLHTSASTVNHSSSMPDLA